MDGADGDPRVIDVWLGLRSTRIANSPIPATPLAATAGITGDSRRAFSMSPVIPAVAANGVAGIGQTERGKEYTMENKRTMAVHWKRNSISVLILKHVVLNVKNLMTWDEKTK
ncbi:hypothetical protein L1887_08229 [Cichorium endivia]|nr:hypothetical protein L1887_08229 [Cichorium endivia]